MALYKYVVLAIGIQKEKREMNMGLFDKLKEWVEKDNARRKELEEKTQKRKELMHQKANERHLNTQKKIDAIKAKQNARKASEAPAQPTKIFKVAGTSYRDKEIKSLLRSNPNYKLTKAQLIKANLIETPVYEFDFMTAPVSFEFEPTNEYDSNAIKVIVHNTHIGYIKKGSCSQLKNLIASNKIAKQTITINGGNYKLVDCTCGDTPIDMSDYEYESIKRNLSVSITITLTSR